MAKEFMERGPNVPTEERALRRLEQHVELGNLQDLEAVALPAKARCLVTYMNFQTGGKVRSSTIVSITNQSSKAERDHRFLVQGIRRQHLSVGIIDSGASAGLHRRFRLARPAR
jgi:hypothetical protein